MKKCKRYSIEEKEKNLHGKATAGRIGRTSTLSIISAKIRKSRTREHRSDAGSQSFALSEQQTSHSWQRLFQQAEALMNRNAVLVIFLDMRIALMYNWVEKQFDKE